jgi:hypothetical protein
MFEDQNDNQQENQDFDPENQRFLEREEDEYLKTLAINDFIKDFLENLCCNAASNFLVLYCIEAGLGVLTSCAVGMAVGTFSGCKDLFQSAQQENPRPMLFKGVLKILFSLFICWQASSEWRNVETMASKAAQYYQEDVRRYEQPQLEPVDNNLMFLIYLAGGAGVLLAVKNSFRRD